MTLGIIVCGQPPAELVAAYGGYAGMIETLLGPGRAATTFDATAGQLPGAGDECDGYVLTGSSAGVYDDLPWIPPLLAFLRQARGRVPLVGICFGHQAMATAWGGRVEKSAKGWGIGLQPYGITRRAPWMDHEAATEIRLPASHQDQVVELPTGATVVAASAFTPFAALDYGDAISFQFHPEFRPDFARALIATRRDRYGALAEPALASYAEPGDNPRVGAWIGRFLGGGGGLPRNT